MDIAMKTATISALAVIIAALIALLGNLAMKGAQRGAIIAVIVAIVICLGGEVLIFLLPLPISVPDSPTPQADVCPYRGKNDEATIRYILDEVTNAAVREDFDTIKIAYFPDATVVDAGQIWRDPAQYHKDVFARYDILDIENTNIRVQINSDESATIYLTSSAQVMGEGSSISKYSDNSSKVQFRKDTNGCWRISEFDRILIGNK